MILFRVTAKKNPRQGVFPALDDSHTTIGSGNLPPPLVYYIDIQCVTQIFHHFSLLSGGKSTKKTVIYIGFDDFFSFHLQDIKALWICNDSRQQRAETQFPKKEINYGIFKILWICNDSRQPGFCITASTQAFMLA